MPPNEENKIRDPLQNLPFSISSELLKERGVKFFEIIQEANEIVFVPSQWYHQVRNLTDVFSINHNWFNGCNVETIFKNILRNHQEVISEIADCNDMDNFEEHCQIMLKSVFGMNFEEIFNLLNHIAEKRCNLIKNQKQIEMFKTFTLGHNHALYDLQIIVSIFEQMRDLHIQELVDEKIEIYKKCFN
jgi:JmjC domain, hydroxylase